MEPRDELSVAPEVPTGDRMSPQPNNLGELKRSSWSEEKIAGRTIRQELRENLLQKMEKGEPLFPGVHGYDDTVIPQITNALLSRHHFILLGLRGQAKSRILRGLMGFLDPQIPVHRRAARFNDNPYTSAVPRVPRTHCCGRRRHTDRLAFARVALRGEAGHARRDHRGHDRRRGPDQSRARRPNIFPTS